MFVSRSERLDWQSHLRAIFASHLNWQRIRYIPGRRASSSLACHGLMELGGSRRGVISRKKG